MSQQKSIKQLLGNSSERKQVSLNLDEVNFRAPNVSAGQYSVQVQQTLRADQTQAGQLANALGRYAGPIARQYQSIEQQRQEEYTQVADLLTPEQAKAVAAGNVEPLRAQFEETANKLDSAQRKKFLKFIENPNNYIRASRIVGQKVASFVDTDIIENQDKFTQSETDVSTQLQQTVQDIASSPEYNLTGYALEGFIQRANDVIAKRAPALIEKQDKYKEEQYIASAIDSLAQSAKNDNFEDFVTDFTASFSGYTPAEQAEHLSSVVSLVSSIDPLQAQTLVGFLDDKLTLGNKAALSEGVMNTLSEQIDQAIVSQNEFENRQKAAFTQKTNVNIANAMLQINNGEPVESFTIQLLDGEYLEVNTDGITSTRELYENLAKTVYSSEMASDADKALYSTQFNTKANEIALEEETRFDSLGGSSAVTELKNRLEYSIAGTNVFGLDANGILDEVNSFEDELEQQINDIYRDPSINSGEKVRKANMLINKSLADKLSVLDGRLNTEKMTGFVGNILNKANLNPNQAVVNNLTRDILAEITLGLSPTSDQIAFAKEQAEAIIAPLREQAQDILTAPLTEEEKSNLTQAWLDREAKIEELKRSISYNTVIDLYNTQEEEKQKQPTEPTEDKKAEVLVVNPNINLGAPVRKPKRRQQGPLDRAASKQMRVMARLNRRNEKIDSGIKELQDTHAKLVSASIKYNMEFTSGELEQLRNKWTVVNDELYDDYTSRRVMVEGKPAITLDELREGVVDGAFRFNVDRLTPDTAAVMPIISAEMIASQIKGEDTYDDEIRQYAEALNIDTSNETELSRFLTRQAKVFQDKYGIPFFINNK